MNLAEIDTQDASTLICDYLACASCGVIDRDHARIRSGTRCSTCGKEGTGGRLAFPISIHVLVDLVQQAYHSKAPVGPTDGPQLQGIGTILMFCALREALLNWFLIRLLRAQKVPAPLMDKLLADNKLASQKFGDLFTAVVGEKWERALEEVSRGADVDYLATSNLMKEAAAIRNAFLHEGSAWRATQQLATECVNAMPSLMSLFVGLHNAYAHPLLRQDSV